MHGVDKYVGLFYQPPSLKFGTHYPCLFTGIVDKRLGTRLMYWTRSWPVDLAAALMIKIQV